MSSARSTPSPTPTDPGVRAVVGVLAGLTLALASLAVVARAATALPTPASVLGFEPCADYKLATYEAIDTYLRALDSASDRMTLVDIGRSVGGRPLRLAVISSPRNLARLEHYRRIAASLALGRRDGQALTEQAARALARDGRAVVWVDFGLHSSEVAAAQAAPLFAWRMVSGESDEIRRMRDDVVLLLMPNMNPDGTTMVANWYTQHVGTAYEKAPLPELYHRYIGHDNNRDWFMLTQPESQAVARQLYHVWFPQIIHNQHQEAPFPARIFVPPFEDPVNPHIAPLVVRGINAVGDAITRRLEQEGKVGAVSRVQFDAWWNGGMRTAPYFHNMIGILTETAHASATPANYDAAAFPRAFSTGLSTSEPSMSYPSPYRGGRWTQRDSCEYLLTASMAVVDLASKRREEWLYDIFRMGRDQVRAGAAETFLVPPQQWDPPTAVAMINTLRRGGVDVEQATRRLRGQRPDVRRRHLRDSRRAAVSRLPARPLAAPALSGPPAIAGRTAGPAVRHHRMDPAAADGRASRRGRHGGRRAHPAGHAGDRRTATGEGLEQAGMFAVDGRVNNSVRLVNQLLAAGVTVERLAASLDVDDLQWPAGTFLVPVTDRSRPLVRHAVDADGVPVRGLPSVPAGPRVRLAPPRVGLYQPWGGNSDEGWTRYLLEQFGFTSLTLRDADIRHGGLRDRLDALVLPDASYQSLLTGLSPATMPAAYTGGLGPRGVAALYEFVEAGGTLVALDSASELPLTAFGLSITNVLPASPTPSSRSLARCCASTSTRPARWPGACRRRCRRFLPTAWRLGRRRPRHATRSEPGLPAPGWSRPTPRSGCCKAAGNWAAIGSRAGAPWSRCRSAGAVSCWWASAPSTAPNRTPPSSFSSTRCWPHRRRRHQTG